MRVLIVALTLLLPAVSTAVVLRWAENQVQPPVRSITTTIRYVNGDEQHNEGSGFVIGDRFYTAYHNIQTTSASVAHRDILIGGVAVEPAAVDIAHDLAVFEIPEELCVTWCNELQLVVRPPGSTARVTWTRMEGNQRTWKHGRVNNLAFKSALVGSDPGGCDDNLIVEIDQPFVPGSSGGPVFDLSTGHIIGIIQGSFETRSGEVTGYYKPVQCVVSRLQKLSPTPPRT